jgi:hypothetical protein
MNSASKQLYLTTLEWVCRIAVAAIFLLAAVPKLLDPLDFAKAITNYRVAIPPFGQDYVFAVAVFLPAFEAVIALALFFNRWKRTASLLASLLLVLFLILISQAVVRGLNIDCGCFGTGALSKALASKVGIGRILEDVAYLALSVFVYWRSLAQDSGQKRYALDRESAWK